MNRILVIDDEPDLCEILLFNLTAAGYEAQAVHSAEEALEHDLSGYHLLLLDVMMPGMSGFQLADKLKQDKQTKHIPIIFLTAKDTEDDLLRGFGLGADDYVTKPFSVREVMARVKAVLHRASSEDVAQEETLTFEGLSLDNIRKQITVDGKEVSLTKTEFELLRLLLSRVDYVFSREQLLSGAWPSDVVVTNRTVDVNIARMRKKLGPYASHIVSRQGYGYCFST